MIENRDGSFGKISPLTELFKTLQDKPEMLEQAKAIHLGTRDELEKKLENAQKADLEWRMSELEKKLNRIIIHLGIGDKSEILLCNEKAINEVVKEM